MIHQYAPYNNWDRLSASSPCGIFIGNDTNLTPYWIVRTEQGKIAIRLNDTTEWNTYSHFILTSEAAVFGQHLGRAALSISKQHSGNGLAYPGRAGALYHKEWWLFIKLKREDGTCSKHRLADVIMDFSKDEKSYLRWDLYFGDEFSHLCGRISNYAMYDSKPNHYHHRKKFDTFMDVSID